MPTSSKRSRGNQLWLGLFVAAMLPAWTASGSSQAGLALASLTVPDKNLPDDCRLRPYVPPTTAVVRGGQTMLVPNPRSSSPFPSNPWFGDRFIIEVRKRIDGGPPLPDAPPLSAAEVSKREGRWVADVVEAYRALYDSADGFVEVLAVRFDDAKLATETPAVGAPLHTSRGIHRLVIGAAVVQVQAAGSKTNCFQAVDAFIRALK